VNEAAVTIHIALLRAVNLGAHNKVGMAELRALLAKLGMEDPRSLLQSGNLVFGGGSRGGAPLELLLEAEARKRLGLDTDFFVRTDEEWREVIAGNPFPAEARSDPGHLVVVFLKAAPDSKSVAALQASIKGREVVRARGRHAYITYPDGIGRSKVTAALIEKKLGTRGTARNWNTVLKLGALAGAAAT
jgi:uncharacterized protein (DUF1697 family)